MCGIVGILADQKNINLHDNIELTINKMSQKLSHRGPDDHGSWSDRAKIALAHRRLSILDLSEQGHQPMLSACGRYVIVFNGEIYNFQQIKKQLPQSHYRGHSDTEVLLNTISYWGIKKSLVTFNGMFAFALWDIKKQQLTLARDRIGKKPLYYGQIADKFIFTSELKTLKCVPGFEPEINYDALTLYLRYNYIPTPYSIFKKFNKLPAGSYMTIDLKDVSQKSILENQIKYYWSATETAEKQFHNLFEGNEKLAVNQLDNLLHDAIEIRMLSDVPLGVLLSGGVDSSTVAAIMQNISNTPINSFSIGFENSEKDEAHLAKSIANHLKTNHHELYISGKDALDVIPKIPQIYDEPFADSSQIPTYLVAKMAKKSVTVALSGDGGDELFYGYKRYYRNARNWSIKQKIPDFLNSSISSLIKKMSSRSKIETRLDKLISNFSENHPLDFYHNRFSQLLKPEKLILREQNSVRMQQFEQVRLLNINDIEKNMMLMDYMAYLSDDILVKVDRASMAVSLEVRNPILDHRITEFAWSLPLSLKYKGNKGKYILREVMSRYIPKDLSNHPKQGFGSPIRSWLHGPLSEWAEHLLDEKKLQQQGIFKADSIREIWRQFNYSNKKYHSYLWNILMFQAWFEDYKN